MTNPNVDDYLLNCFKNPVNEIFGRYFKRNCQMWKNFIWDHVTLPTFHRPQATAEDGFPISVVITVMMGAIPEQVVMKPFIRHKSRLYCPTIWGNAVLRAPGQSKIVDSTVYRHIFTPFLRFANQMENNTFSLSGLASTN